MLYALCPSAGAREAAEGVGAAPSPPASPASWGVWDACPSVAPPASVGVGLPSLEGVPPCASGACSGCPLSSVTLGMGIERILKEHVPGVTRVVAEEPDFSMDYSAFGSVTNDDEDDIPTLL